MEGEDEEAAQDNHSEEAIPFASVSLKKTRIGKLSDSSGHFSIYDCENGERNS